MARSRRRSPKGIWGFLERVAEFLLATPAAWLAPVIVIVSITIYVAIPSPPNLPPPPVLPPPPPVFPPNDNWDAVQVDTTDSTGRLIGVRLGTLNENYRWLLGNTKFVGISGQDSILISTALASLRRDVASPIVVVGMASHENAAERPDEENGRAQTRADELAEFAQRHFMRSPEIYKVNLGAYRSDAPSTTPSAVERRVVVMQITCRDTGVDLQSGIRNALIKAGDLRETSIDGSSYTNFETDKFRVTTASTGVQRRGVPPECKSPTAARQ